MTVWIGLVGVGCLPGGDPLHGRQGAYVNTLAWASSAADFKAKVRAGLADRGLFPFEFEDVEPFELRIQSHSPDEELCDLANEVRTVGGTRFGKFYSYRGTDG